jgi:hypothetical protein
MEERNRWSRRNQKLIRDSAERSGGGRLGEITWRIGEERSWVGGGGA